MNFLPQISSPIPLRDSGELICSWLFSYTLLLLRMLKLAVILLAVVLFSWLKVIDCMAIMFLSCKKSKCRLFTSD